MASNRYKVVTFKISTNESADLFVVDTMKNKNWDCKVVVDLPDGNKLVTVIIKQIVLQESTSDFLSRRYKSSDSDELSKKIIAEILSDIIFLPERFNQINESCLLNYIDRRKSYLSAFKADMDKAFNTGNGLSMPYEDSLISFVTFVSNDPIIATEEIYSSHSPYPQYLLTFIRATELAKKIIKENGIRTKKVGDEMLLSESAYHKLITSNIVMVDKSRLSR